MKSSYVEARSRLRVRDLLRLLLLRRLRLQLSLLPLPLLLLRRLLSTELHLVELGCCDDLDSRRRSTISGDLEDDLRRDGDPLPPPLLTLEQLALPFRRCCCLLELLLLLRDDMNLDDDDNDSCN